MNYTAAGFHQWWPAGLRLGEVKKKILRQMLSLRHIKSNSPIMYALHSNLEAASFEDCIWRLSASQRFDEDCPNSKDPLNLDSLRRTAVMQLAFEWSLRMIRQLNPSQPCLPQNSRCTSDDRIFFFFWEKLLDYFLNVSIVFQLTIIYNDKCNVKM